MKLKIGAQGYRLKRSLPQCSVCRKACEKGVLTLLNKNFCSKRCMYKVMRCALCRKGLNQVVVWKLPNGRQIKTCKDCADNPKCYYCGVPSASSPLPDGRRHCRKCRQTAVKDHQNITALFQKVRNDLALWYGFDKTHKIELKIVDLSEMEETSNGVYLPDGGKRLALMRYFPPVMADSNGDGKADKIIRREKCQIFVMAHTPKDVLLDTFAHELTHDHLRHNVGQVKDLAREEGFCELVASLYNIRIKQAHLNKAKELHKDPVYGEGFRKMRDIYRKNKSLKETMKQLR